MSAKVLIVDDEPTILRALVRILRNHYEVHTAATGADALDRLARERFDVVMCDLMMPHVDGLDVYRQAQDLLDPPGPGWVLMTGGVVPPEAEALVEAGSAQQLGKPFVIREVEQAVQAALAADRPAPSS